MTNVLIVEDEPAISDMERDFLEGCLLYTSDAADEL